MFFASVDDTGDKLFKGENDTGDVVISNKLQPVLLTMAITRLVEDFHRFHDSGNGFITGNNNTDNN